MDERFQDAFRALWHTSPKSKALHSEHGPSSGRWQPRITPEVIATIHKNQWTHTQSNAYRCSVIERLASSRYVLAKPRSVEPILAPEKLQQALANFSEAVKYLPEDEQRELYKLLFKSVIVKEGGKAKDPVNENSRRTRENRRHLSVEVRLRTEAIQTLFDGESDSERKKGFTLPLEIAHCRKKPMENCAILSPVHKECGQKAHQTRKRPKKTEHEIHRAIRWKKEMDELGIGQNELARRKGYSCPAVAAVMAWLKLCPEAVEFIKNIPEYKSTRSISRSYRKRLFGMNASEQISAIKELLSKN